MDSQLLIPISNSNISLPKSFSSAYAIVSFLHLLSFLSRCSATCKSWFSLVSFFLSYPSWVNKFALTASYWRDMSFNSATSPATLFSFMGDICFFCSSYYEFPNSYRVSYFMFLRFFFSWLVTWDLRISWRISLEMKRLRDDGSSLQSGFSSGDS